MESVIATPRTAVELFRLLPEGVLCEVIDNVIYMSPAATHEHQRIKRKIMLQMTLHVEKNNLGETFDAPIDVFLDHRNAFQPDIIFIATENLTNLIPNGGFNGAPDLVIEILSLSNRQYDLGKKKDAYEKNGVKEYWVVDPFTKEAIGYLPEKKSFREFARATGKLKSKLLRKEFRF